jgi:uncharacterized protein (TIGR03435 family)
MLRPTVFLLAIPLLHAQFSIEPNRSGNQSFRLKNGTLEAEGQTVEQLLQFAYHMQAGCTLGPAWITEKVFDVHGVANAGEKVRPLVQEALRDHFKFVVRKETRPMDVYVLKAGPDAEAKLGNSSAADGEEMSHIRGKDLSAESIARYLSSWFGKPVIDETGLHGRYAVNITWDANNSDNLIPAVERVGLRLEKDRRPVDVLIVSVNGASL